MCSRSPSATGASGELVALDGVSLSVGRGDIVGLVGRKRAGKTTLMRSVPAPGQPPVVRPRLCLYALAFAAAVARQEEVQFALLLMPGGSPSG